MGKKRLLFVVNDWNFFLTHRLALAIAARDTGYDVHIATPQGKSEKAFNEPGLIFHAIHLSRKGKNPLQEAKTLLSIYRLLRQVKPDLVHLVTIKPILYGGLMARLIKVPAVIAAVSGLGAVFTAEGFAANFLQAGIKKLYSLALKHPNLKVIFQNEDDRDFLISQTSFSAPQAVLIRGSGVDINQYQPVPERGDKIVVMMVARLLKDKGVLEFINAAKIIKSSGIQAQFVLVGESDHNNPAFIEDKLIAQWQAEGTVELLGFREDITELMAQANIIVLPSYREGLPKVLVEAAACGRAIVTTDVPGCRDAIKPNETGLLVPVKDAKALSIAIEQLIKNPEQRKQFGKAGRKLAENEFAIEHIVAAHLDVYSELTTYV